MGKANKKPSGSSQRGTSAVPRVQSPSTSHVSPTVAPSSASFSKPSVSGAVSAQHSQESRSASDLSDPDWPPPPPETVRGRTQRARQARADWLGARLDERYSEPPVPLDHRDPYTLLIAVLLSAQCTDLRVNQVTPQLFQLADHPAAMAQVPVTKVYEVIKPCGLAPQKSQAIVGLSQILVERYGGVVPANWEELEQLPGVGHKTASVVMAQAFGIPAFPVDTHIHRLAQRWELSSGRNVAETERDLKSLFAESTWNRRHLQIIFYGREYCSARGCDGRVCPFCRALFPNRKRSQVARKA